MRRSGNSRITAISSPSPAVVRPAFSRSNIARRNRRVFVHTGEVHAAAQHQLLPHSPLEAMVPLLNIAVLVAMSSLSLLALQAVRRARPRPLYRSVNSGRIAHVVDRRREPVRPMTLWYLA